MKRPQPWPKAPPLILPAVMWVDQWGCVNTMTHKRAGEILKEFYDAWPCGLDEVESSIAGHKRVIDRMTQFLRNLSISEFDIENVKFGKKK